MATANIIFTVQESAALEPGKIVHLKGERKIIVPADGTYYRIMFMHGLTDEAINSACSFALSKVLSWIERQK